MSDNAVHYRARLQTDVNVETENEEPSTYDTPMPLPL